MSDTAITSDSELTTYLEKLPVVKQSITRSANTKYCPAGCGTVLLRKNLSETQAIKGCIVCKRKFTFVRTDTLAGRAMRAKQRYNERSIYVRPIVKTAAQRMAAMRLRKEASAAMKIDMYGGADD